MVINSGKARLLSPLCCGVVDIMRSRSLMWWRGLVYDSPRDYKQTGLECSGNGDWLWCGVGWVSGRGRSMRGVGLSLVVSDRVRWVHGCGVWWV